MIAIVTRKLPPTMHHGSRISARANDFRCVVQYEYSGSEEDEHRRALDKLIKKHPGFAASEGCDWFPGWLPNGDCAWVHAPGKWKP